jgi:hypothetical protein
VITTIYRITFRITKLTSQLIILPYSNGARAVIGAS